ncbi:hypothetical protein A9Q91_01445 [Candidatus Gracilibacteria bacterium 28_42_T64]|nr:hypothetical protein A9Q91_01445 [Candidatus Gracilibacteria bacterium 28_42_T64]
MSESINIEISKDYLEHLELLKQVIPDASGEDIKDNGKMIETLIDSFMAFIQEQAGAHEHSEDGNCCEHDH